MHLIQAEYKELLTALLPKLKSRHVPEALDEINLFWLRNIEEVQLYLRAWFPGENSYVFTAATYMDYDDKEYLPFLLMGDKHILDDPLSRYAEIQSKMPEGKDAEFLYKQIGVTAEDNLKLLENVGEKILILPLRILNQSNDYNSFYKVGEQAFVSLFNGINSVSDYFSKCESIDDIMQYARGDIGRLVMFSEDDDITVPIKDRFIRALAELPYMVNPQKQDAYNFFMMVFGCIQQAIDIIASCIEYKCTPYIRYPVSLHYVNLLSENILDKEFMSKLCFKMNIAFAVHQLCDKDKLASVGFERFLEKQQQYDFDKKLLHALSMHGINEENFENRIVPQIVTDELEKFYSTLLVSE